MAMLEERLKRQAGKPRPKIATQPGTPGKASVNSVRPSPRQRSQTPTGRSNTPLRSSRSMQSMGDRPPVPAINGLSNGAHSDDEAENGAETRRVERIPDDGGFTKRLPNGEYDWKAMGYDWPEPGQYRVEEPELTEWQSVFESENRDPFQYPSIKSASPPPPSPTQGPGLRTNLNSLRVRRGSEQSLVSVGSSSTIMDSAAALDTTISQICSKSIYTAISSLVQLDELIKDSSDADRVGLMSGRTDQVLQAIYFQLRLCLNSHLSDQNIERSQVVELYRAVGNLLVSLIKLPTLIREATEMCIKDLLVQLLRTLLDERFKHIEGGGDQVIKSVNWLVVKVVEGSERTACLVALMSLLRETLASQTDSPKFLDLTLKCLWRKCKELQSMTREQADMLVAAPIIEESERFYLAFPPSSWQGKDDKPMKTIKTILNYIAKAMGDKILDEIGGLQQDPRSSEVVAYLKKSLRDLPPREENGNRLGPTGMTESITLSASSSTDKKPLSEANNNGKEGEANRHSGQLQEIFRTIADKNTSKKGIQALFKYQKDNPDADIQPFMLKSTDFFQQYVQRGLEQARREDGERRRTQNLAPASSIPRIGSTGDVTNLRGTESRDALARLNAIRQRGGLSPVTSIAAAPMEATLPQVEGVTGAGRGATMTRSPRSEKSPNQPKPKAKIPPSELNDLKDRLARLKRGQLD